jgi:hypothetical protein
MEGAQQLVRGRRPIDLTRFLAQEVQTAEFSAQPPTSPHRQTYHRHAQPRPRRVAQVSWVPRAPAHALHEGILGKILAPVAASGEQCSQCPKPLDLRLVDGFKTNCLVGCKARCDHGYDTHALYSRQTTRNPHEAGTSPLLSQAVNSNRLTGTRAMRVPCSTQRGRRHGALVTRLIRTTLHVSPRGGRSQRCGGTARPIA